MSDFEIFGIKYGETGALLSGYESSYAVSAGINVRAAKRLMFFEFSSHKTIELQGAA